jgi:hypothetical protein
LTLNVASEAWQTEQRVLAEQVDCWFRNATKRFDPPSHHGCELISFYLMLFQFCIDPADNDKQADSRRKAFNYGNRFLDHIEPKRRELEAQLCLAARGTPARPWLEEWKDLAFRIDEIRRHMKVLLPALSPKRDVREDPVRKFATLAQEAWAETNGGRAPRSKNADDPLVKFLVPALTAIGHGRTPAAISDILRDRRRRRGRFRD